MKYSKLSVFCATIVALAAVSGQAAVLCVGDAAALQSALDIADNNGQDDEIRLRAGTYDGNFVYNANAAETGGLTIAGGYDAPCAVRSDDPASTVLDGQNLGPTLVVSGRDNSAVSITGLTVQNGLGQAQGAGLDLDRWVAVSVTNSAFRNNRTAQGQDGAAGAQIDRSVSVVVTDNVFEGNQGGKGGGLSLSDSSQAMIARNRFLGNGATLSGAGLEADTAGIITLSNNLFDRNVSLGDGGAVDINLETLNTAGRLQATNNTFFGNSANGDGGAVDGKMVGDATSATFQNNIFWQNVAGLLGHDMNIDNDDEQNGIASAIILGANDFNQSPPGFFTTLPVVIPAGNFNAVNPLFVNQAAGDFHLQPGSVLIDSGDSGADAVGATDLGGDMRVQGLAVDLGVFEAPGDSDGDGLSDAQDNCVLVANADQRDSDGDGFGNLCDADLNDDGIVNAQDLGLLRLVFFSADPDADFNGDGQVNSVDLGLFKGLFGSPPGPSGLAR